MQQALFGGGCFWCVEAVYLELQGIHKVTSGYAGGDTDNPTYEDICRGDTNHAEVILVDFDETQISYAQLLDVFFAIHDPTTPNRQGHDIGPQYRSIIFAMSPEQAAQAEMAMRELTGLPGPVVTELVRVGDPVAGPIAHRFFAAESEHQNYFRDHPWQGYCMAVVAPKVAKAEQHFTALIAQ